MSTHDCALLTSILTGLVFCGACASPRVPPPPSITECHQVPAPVLATPPALPQTTDPLLGRLLDAVNALPAKEGWLLREYHVTSKHDAAIGILDQVEPLADCNRGQPLVLVGHREVLSTGLTSGYSLLSAPNGTLLWNLRGDGPRFLVVEERLCNFASTTRIFGIDEHGEWVSLEGDARPSCVTCTRPKEEALEDKPLFSSYAVSLTLASGGPYFPTTADVYLLEAWDGQRFRTNLPAFAPLYERRLAAARDEGKRARRLGSSKCNRGLFLAAGEIYVYSRVLGNSEAAALAEIDRLVKDISTKPCEKNHDDSIYGAQSFDWATIRDELLFGTRELPVIQTKATPAPHP